MKFRTKVVENLIGKDRPHIEDICKYSYRKDRNKFGDYVFYVFCSGVSGHQVVILR